MTNLSYDLLQEHLESALEQWTELMTCATKKVNSQKTIGEALDHYSEQELALRDIYDHIVYSLDTVEKIAKKNYDFDMKYGI